MKERDIFGIMYLDYYENGKEKFYTIRRDDGFTATKERVSVYFQNYADWADIDKKVLKSAHGKILDFAAGAGRHALYFQNKGYEVHAFDNSPLAVEVMRRRGIKNACLGDINAIEKLAFPKNYFNTVLMMFNNFGLAGNIPGTKETLSILHKLTSDNANIIYVGRNPHITNNPVHINYNKCIKLRIEYKKKIGPWYVLLMVSPKEMEIILQDTGWRIQKIEHPECEIFGAVLCKK